ncbi:MAG: hypothetical protein CK425_00830 [Parachlamydia sp.]|nr:MAG: hypothetical protein CK425_00830 [Parachlamydia sp.]
MFKVSHKTLVAISGSVWIGVGLFLLQLGIGLLLEAMRIQLIVQTDKFPILNFLAGMGGVKVAALMLVILSLIVGFFKGRFVLRKTVVRSVARIRSFPDPTMIYHLYSKGNIVLILAMMGLGMLMRFLGVASDVRAFIDIAVGMALIQGGVLYLRSSFLAPRPA